MANYLQCIPHPHRTILILMLFFANFFLSKGFSTSLSTNISKPNGWSHWSHWSACSKSCLGGIHHRSRSCSAWSSKSDAIVYATKEVECQGNSVEYKICNTQPCPETTLDSRSLQCSSHNGKTVRGREIRVWEPSNNGYNLCELNCFTPQYGFSYSFGKVEDGTLCYEATDTKICLNGRCMPLGCDLVVGSTLKNDMCGLCGGKNLTCQKIEGIFHKWSNVKSGYSEVVKIPANSRSIIIRDNSRNYIALLDSGRSSIINGNGLVDPPGHYGAAGAIFEYSGAHHMDETLGAKGPTDSDVFVMVQVLIRDQSPKIHYEYWVPLSGTDAQAIRMQATTFYQHSSITSSTTPSVKPQKMIPKSDFSNIAKEHLNRPLGTQKVDLGVKKKKKKKPKLGKEDKRCPPCSRARNIKQQFCDSDFVVRALVMNSEQIKRETRYELQVLQSYKNLVPLQTFEYLWLLDTCKCPKMMRSREYLIMGKMDKSASNREVRLVVHRRSYIRRYSQKGALKVLQIKREVATLCGNDRSRNRI